MSVIDLRRRQAGAQPEAPPAVLPLVSLRDVHLSFGATDVLKGIDVEVRQGQAVSIIGPSGSGKSTILRCITGLLRPQRGAIHVDGVAVHALAAEAQLIALRKQVGFVFQQYNLFPHLSVLENLVIAPVRVGGAACAQAIALARELLAKVRMEHKENAYPGELSGGQQQRVAIARALAMRPKLILFDEVTSALDPEMVGEVLTVIRDLVRDGLTCLLVTHEMRFAEEVSDTVYFTEAAVSSRPARRRACSAPPATPARVRSCSAPPIRGLPPRRRSLFVRCPSPPWRIESAYAIRVQPAAALVISRGDIMTQASSIAAERQQQVNAALADVRGLLANATLDRDVLGRITRRIEQLAAATHLFSREDFPPPARAEEVGASTRYRLNPEGRDDDVALYLNSINPGKTTVPHNHTTWAVIVAIAGDELNRVYRRTDDGSDPSRAALEQAREVVVRPGQSIAFLPDDIHSIHVTGDEPTLHFHLYGRPLETLSDRIGVNLETGEIINYNKSHLRDSQVVKA